MQETDPNKRVWRILTPIFIQWGMSFVGSMCISIWLMAKSFPQLMAASTDQSQLTKLMNEMMEEMLRYSVEITIITAALTIPVVLWMFLSDRKKEKLAGLVIAKKAPLWQYGILLVMGVVVCLGLNNVLTLLNLVLSSAQYQDASEQLYSIKFGLQLISWGLLLPIAEELIFRGLIYKRLREYSSVIKAACFSALLFGVYHGNLIQGIYAFIIGGILAYVYETYGSIKAPIFLHVVVNVTSIMATKYDLFIWMFKEPLRVGIVSAVCAGVGASMYVLIQKLNKDMQETKDIQEAN
ncbi:MAG: CPBP family intramembrane glutamic endopeptidase [Lachnospiraceae bacterium]